MKLCEISEFVVDKINSSKLALTDYVTTDSLLQNKRGRECAQNLPPVPCTLTSFKKGDVLVANIRPYLKKVWLADKDGGCSSDVLAFRATNGHSSLFLYAVLMQDAFFDYVMQGAKGSKMPRGDKSQIMRYELPTFSSLEEKNIGNFVFDIVRKIQLNCQINDNLEAMAKQLYDYWFVQFDFPNEEGKPYKSSGGAMVWNEKLKREIPQGWSTLPISAILDKYSTTKRYETKEYLSQGKYPIIDQGDTYIVGYTNEDDNLLTRHPAVLFGDHSTKVKFLDFDFARGADGTQILYSSNDAVSQYYLYLAVSTLQIPNPGYSRHFKYLKELPIVIPSLSIAIKFANIVKPLFKKWTNNIFNNIALTKQRDELLPLLMNGQASVNSD